MIYSYIHRENLIHVYRHFTYSISITGPIRKKFRAHLWLQVHKSHDELQEYRCAIMIRQKYNITSHCWPFDLSVCMLSLLESLQGDKKITLLAWTIIWNVIKMHSVSDIKLLLVPNRTLQIVLHVVRFEVLTVVAKKITIFCNVTPCSFLMCFRETIKSQYTFTRLFSHIPEETLSSVLYVCMYVTILNSIYTHTLTGHTHYRLTYRWKG